MLHIQIHKSSFVLHIRMCNFAAKIPQIIEKCKKHSDFFVIFYIILHFSPLSTLHLSFFTILFTKCKFSLHSSIFLTNLNFFSYLCARKLTLGCLHGCCGVRAQTY